MDVGDLDGNARPDIVEGGEDALLWYRNPDWSAQPLATGFRYAAGAMVVVRDVDVDGDGRNDVVTGRYPVGRESEPETLWFGNAADGWVPHLLSPTAFCHDLAFGDLDGDGDGRSDVVGHEGNAAFADPRAHGRISWWQSTTTPDPAPPPTHPPRPHPRPGTV
jgi:hypothetical protein